MAAGIVCVSYGVFGWAAFFLAIGALNLSESSRRDGAPAAEVGAVAPSEDLELERWGHVLAVNLTGAFLCSQAVGRHMLTTGRGVIINIGSIFGETGMPMRAAYAASKHGLLGLTRVLAAEWASRGVRVVAVEPGYVRTSLDDQDQTDGGYTAGDIIGRTPMGRYAEPEEIAATVAFLASNDAFFITGSSIVVDGGWLAHAAGRTPSNHPSQRCPSDRRGTTLPSKGDALSNREGVDASWLGRFPRPRSRRQIHSDSSRRTSPNL
jgi:NAD(P)-dependent dehydrogenase (short-subunit alcohol dehydrogenase family)